MMDAEHFDEFGTSFLRLALEIGKHVDGYVDAYYGPNILRKEIASTPLLSFTELSEHHHRLKEILPTEDINRHRYLDAILNAMECTIGKIGGESYEYLEEVELLYGITPKLVNEELFLEAQKTLDAQLPGNGTLADKIKKRRNEMTIPPQDIPRAVGFILEEIQRRTKESLSLVPGELVETEFVHEKPYGADCHYLGNYQSLIKINLDLDWQPLGLTSLLTHEAYPGHHTEFQTKEKCLYMEKGYPEESCILILTPRSIIMEGIADTALEVISPNLEIFEWIERSLIPEMKLPNMSALELANLHRALVSLRCSTTNAAILFHSGEIGETEAISYLMEFGLFDQKLAKHLFKMVVDPIYCTYVFTYTEGYSLIDNFSQGESKMPLIKRLLSEQMLPGDIMVAT
jgi:hypothetical protein